MAPLAGALQNRCNVLRERDLALGLGLPGRQRGRPADRNRRESSQQDRKDRIATCVPCRSHRRVPFSADSPDNRAAMVGPTRRVCQGALGEVCQALGESFKPLLQCKHPDCAAFGNLGVLAGKEGVEAIVHATRVDTPARLHRYVLRWPVSTFHACTSPKWSAPGATVTPIVALL